MRAATRSLLDGLLVRTPAQPIFERRASRSLAVLAYHEVSDRDRFVRQLDHLARIAHPVSLDDVIRTVTLGAPLPERAVLLTFDDGHRDLFEVAMPLLRERSIPAVAFVVAGLVDTDLPHWWTEVKELAGTGAVLSGSEGLSPADLVRALKRRPDGERLASIDELRRRAGRAATPVHQLTSRELRELESAGISIGNHSLSHPCLSTCTTEKIVREVEASHQLLTEILGHEPVAFAYPDGDDDPRVTRVVREVGYRVAFGFDHRLDTRIPPDPMRISRLRTDAHASFDRFRIILSGFHPALHRLRGLA